MVMDYSLNYLGGAQSAFLDEADALSEFGHEVSIVAPGTPDSAWANRWEGSIFGVKPRGTIPVVDLPYIPNSRQLRNSLADFFERQNISVVHVHSEFGLAHAAAEAAHSLGIPVVFTVHTFFWEARLPKPLDRAAAPALRRGLLGLTGRRITGEDVTGSPLAAAEVDATLRGATLTLAKLADTVVSPSAHQARRLREAVCPMPPKTLKPLSGCGWCPTARSTQKRPVARLSRWNRRCELCGLGEWFKKNES